MSFTSIRLIKLVLLLEVEVVVVVVILVEVVVVHLAVEVAAHFKSASSVNLCGIAELIAFMQRFSWHGRGMHGFI